MVSVIVPVYNNKEDLMFCVSSLVKQTYKNIEILLIDDGSSQETIAIEKRLALQYKNLRLIYQKNAGVSVARNRGIEEAKGEFVCFVDADDYIEPDMIEKMLSKIKEGYLVVSNFVHNDSIEHILSMPEEAMNFKFDELFIKEYLVGNLGKQIAFSAWNKIFQLNLLKENNIFFPVGVAVGEDMIFVLKYLSVCKGIVCINEGLYHYKIRDTSTMNSTKKDYLKLYCSTLLELKRLKLKGKYIEEAVLAVWSLEMLTYIFTNPYVKFMRYHEFSNYYKQLVKTVLYATAVNASGVVNSKRNVLKWVLKFKSKLFLYTIIKIN